MKTVNIQKFLNINKRDILTVVFVMVLANVFTAYFISQEHWLYEWDTLNYWQKFTYLKTHLLSDPLNTLKAIVYSVREDNYNLLGAAILLPFGFLFGTSRVAYILAIVNFYVILTLISLILLHRKLGKVQGKVPPFLTAIVLSVFVLSPVVWSPVFDGFVDIGGIILINVILMLYLKSSYSKQSNQTLWLIAFLVPLLVLFRRWYAFWGEAFYVVLFLEICVTSYSSKGIDIKGLIRNLSKLSLQMIFSAFFFFLAAPTLTRRILHTDYSDLNAPYRHSAGMIQSFEAVFQHFGLIYAVMTVLGAICALINEKTRRFAIFIIVQWGLMFALFSRTQDFETHHLYLLLPAVLIFSVIGITAVFSTLKRSRAMTFGTLAFFLIMNFLIVFLPYAPWKSRVCPGIFTDIRHPPMVRNDIKEFERILSVLKGLMTDPDDRVYVLSASIVLNYNDLDSAYMTLGRYEDVCKKVLVTNDVDKRKGFSRDFFKATYVIVADPIQYDVSAQYERIVGIPAAMFLQNKGIASSFEKLPYEFELEGNVKVYIYKKIKPYNVSDLDELSQALRAFYPDRKDIYDIKNDR